MTERTLVLLKPDAVRRHLCGEIIRRLEQKGLRIVAMKLFKFDKDLAAQHYNEHVNKKFYPRLEAFILSGPAVAIALEGNDAIRLVRNLMGDTSHLSARPGTIRGDLAFTTTENLIHGSDSPESAEKEIAHFFTDDEIH